MFSFDGRNDQYSDLYSAYFANLAVRAIICGVAGGLNSFLHVGYVARVASTRE